MSTEMIQNNQVKNKENREEIGTHQHDQISGSLTSLDNGDASLVRLSEANDKNFEVSSPSEDLGSQKPTRKQPYKTINLNTDAREIDVIFINPLDNRYACCACDQVLRYPVQFDACPHNICSTCLPELMRVAPRCPIDECHVDREKVFVNKDLQKEIENLGVRCSFLQRDCTWTGVLHELTVHMENCPYRLINCPLKCNVEMEIRFLNKHTEEDCSKRNIQCKFCRTALIAEQETDHLNSCLKFPIKCPNGCKKKELVRENLAAHLKTKCTRHEQDCPFSDYGCEYAGTKKEIREHLNNEFVSHLSLMCEAIKENTRIVEEQSNIITMHETGMELYEARINSLEKRQGPQLLWKIDKYQEKYNDAKTGKKTTLFSTPFLTTKFGYKLTVSVCLYGDGKSKGKFMSMFVCICKGDYDSVLLWPFSHRISLALLDQCQDPNARKDIVYVVKPNPCKENLPFLGRPSGERNASLGAQKFVELDLLNTLDYIRDDTIFIKVIVDCDDMIEL